jgi:hypothetical protein
MSTSRASVCARDATLTIRVFSPLQPPDKRKNPILNIYLYDCDMGVGRYLFVAVVLSSSSSRLVSKKCLEEARWGTRRERQAAHDMHDTHDTYTAHGVPDVVDAHVDFEAVLGELAHRPGLPTFGVRECRDCGSLGVQRRRRVGQWGGGGRGAVRLRRC